MNKTDYVIISDSSCDLSDQQLQDNEIIMVPFYVSIDGKTYQKEKTEMPIREFYSKIVENTKLMPKTALPSIGDYQKVFNENLEKGLNIICVCISSKFSGSYNSACSARNECLQKYPNAQITIIDSMINSGGQGLLVLEMARMKKAGKSYEEVVAITNEMRKTGRIFFTIDNLEYLRRGGRIGKLIGLVGATLKIKPIIFLRDGEIFSEGIAFTRKKAYLKATNAALNYFKHTGEDPNDYMIMTGYGFDEEEGKDYHEKIKTLLNRDDILLCQIGATIGVHTGPHPIGLGFVKRYEKVELSLKEK